MIGIPPAMQGMAPIQGLSPELLAQAAQNAFRPPNPMGMPGMQMPQISGGGYGLNQGMAGLGMGLGALKGLNDTTKPGVPTANGDPTGGAGPAFLGGATSLAAAPGGSGGGGFFDWLTRQFGGASKGII